MINFWVAPYTLTFNHPTPVRRRPGFLLKMQSNEISEGYADCFPWPEFGDPKVEELIEMLRSRISTPLLDRALYWAREDGLARQERRFLLAGQQNLYHHFLWMDFSALKEQDMVKIIAKGFKTIKIKLGHNRESEVDKLVWLNKLFGAQIKLRLDFNGRLAPEYIPGLMVCKDFIEFIEDPYPVIDERWWNFAQATKIPLALDLATGTDEQKQKNSSLQIFKPAKQSSRELIKKLIVFTSYLNHPVGQAQAMAAALAHGKQVLAYGIMSHHVYQPTRFSEAIINQGDRFIIPGEYGIGFEEQLANVKWEKLNIL